MSMDNKYADLSVLGDKAIDIGFLLSKLKNDGYNTFALDYQFSDDSIFKPHARESPKVEDLNIYTRATYVVENQASLHPLGQQSIPYDIVAVRPLNEKIFHSLCVDYDVRTTL